MTPAQLLRRKQGPAAPATRIHTNTNTNPLLSLCRIHLRRSLPQMFASARVEGLAWGGCSTAVLCMGSFSLFGPLSFIGRFSPPLPSLSLPPFNLFSPGNPSLVPFSPAPLSVVSASGAKVVTRELMVVLKCLRLKCRVREMVKKMASARKSLIPTALC